MTPSEAELRAMTPYQLRELKKAALRQRERWADHFRMTLEISPQLKNLEPTETDPTAFTRIQINGWNSAIETVNEILAFKAENSRP